MSRHPPPGSPGDAVAEAVPGTAQLRMYDSLLRQFHGELLDNLDIRCRDSVPDYRWFRDLDDDLWAILLSKQYSLYPNLRRVLPDTPDPGLQKQYTGESGLALAAKSKGFYRRLKDLYGCYGAKPLRESRVLDFGCGWGRLTRYLARDVAPGNLFGCDPDPEILAVCEQTRVPARLARSEQVPSALPFREKFDLIFAFSVFTHLSEQGHERCLRAIHDALERSGVLIVTVRPAAFATQGFAESDPQTFRALMSEKPTYAFVPAPPECFAGQFGEALAGGAFGKAAMINLPYIRERWGELFSLLEVAPQISDMHQVVVTLRRVG